MPYYSGIDLHSNNSVVCVINEEDKVVFQKRFRNEGERILDALEPYRPELKGVVVESTFNWYWLVDLLQERGYSVHLANTVAIKTYDGLKHSGDEDDARHLAHLFRLGLLPEGWIAPKPQRSLRDLMRRRSFLVQKKTSLVLSLSGQMQRMTGRTRTSKDLLLLTPEEMTDLGLPDETVLGIGSFQEIARTITTQIGQIEALLSPRLKAEGPDFRNLKTVPGIGQILAMCIFLETGPISRFPEVGMYASYCRCVDSAHYSNGRKKGQGNTKCGNRYLGWAYLEAANFAIRFYPQVQRFYQKKKQKTHVVVALKTVAHKLARASYYVLRDQVPFSMERCFG